MALVTCPDCGKEISDQAPACPSCGRPREPAGVPVATPVAPPARKTSLTKPAGCFLQVLGFFLLLVGVGLCVPRAGGSLVLGVVLLAVGGWLVVVGRRPAVQR
jgi:zinc-ribbon domain